MGLSDSVEALLETYSKCISLLKIFSSSSHAGSSSRSAAAVAHRSSSSDWDRQSELSRSLRNDRAKIQKAYSDRLSETGSRLRKGDGPSRSALRRIIHRLTDALASIVGLGSSSGGRDGAIPDGRPLLNYDALRALSNASRIDAIHAIDEVSVRLSRRSSASSRRSRSSRASSGRGHSASASAAALPGHPKQSSKRQRRTPGLGTSSGSSHWSSSSNKRGSSKTAVGGGSSNPRKAKKEASLLSRETAAQLGRQHRQSSSNQGRDRSSGSNSNSGSGSAVMVRPRTSAAAAGHVSRRVSMMSSSTASTKLGEIPERKLRRRQPPAANGDDPWAGVAPGYNIRPAYPMRPLRVPNVEPDEGQKPKRRFWGVFGR
ncbi:hypothetical protein SCUCBS95973_000023 [Sporothrix curviconia]|uniref:Uncharacterized protein n=1 Tax=Sporothrix curviconia TaxID=1260050 RepID=A0ABP0AK67_9PEZI